MKIKTELFKKGEHMELKELTEKTLEIFESKDTSELISKIKNVCIENETEYFDRFAELVEDLSVDWLQKIFQYYEADRKEKKQDYTPLSLARFVGKLAGEADTVIDMCAGSGALTIQKWNLDKNQEFMLYEYDEKVIPLLLFNMALRNVQCIIYHSDVLQQEIYNTYSVTRGQKYGTVKEESNELHTDF